MLWMVRHEWPSGARFVFNCYRHWATLLLRGKSGGCFLFSKEGVTQGDPLAMIAYGLATIPLMKSLVRVDDVDWSQIWYADDASVMGPFSEINKFFDKLTILGTAYGYTHTNHGFISITDEDISDKYG